MTSGPNPSDPRPSDPEVIEAQASACLAFYQSLSSALSTVVVGQSVPITQLLTTVFAQGHALLEGMPGLGKTLLVRTLADLLELDFARIQCTPDLMPADITGTTVLSQSKDGAPQMRFQRGPVFANIVLADELNRATPRTQAALLEAMEESSVSVGGTTHLLLQPFFVLATQNPIDLEGTFPLPEAQLDRFQVKILVDQPSTPDLVRILAQTTANPAPAQSPIGNSEQLVACQRFIRTLVCPQPVLTYVANLVANSHPSAAQAPVAVREYVRFGASPRAAQAIVRAAKVAALVRGGLNVGFADVRSVAHGCLRHRLILTFAAQAEDLPADTIVDDLLATVPQPS